MNSKLRVTIACLSILMMSSGLQGMNIGQADQTALNKQLLNAVGRGNVQQIKQLISNGADINARNAMRYTPLMMAAEDGNQEVCEFLINNGADIYARNREGWTALMWAALVRHKEICKLLIRAMIKPTPEQVKTVVALIGTKKFRQSEQLNVIGRDVVRLIGKEKYKAFERENKPKAEIEISKIQDIKSRDELLRYLNSL